DSRRPMLSVSRTSGIGSPPPDGISSPFTSTLMMTSRATRRVNDHGPPTGRHDKDSLTNITDPGGRGRASLRKRGDFSTLKSTSGGVAAMLAPVPLPAGLTADRRYYPLSRFLRERFGGTVYRVTIDAGFTCPNVDGTVTVGGCVFCDNRSFSP